MYQYDELRDLYTFVCGQALTISPRQDKGRMCDVSHPRSVGGRGRASGKSLWR